MLLNNKIYTMNIFDKALLAFVLLPKRIYQKAGIDVTKLKSILIYKLLMDDRSPNSIQKIRNQNNKSNKEPSKISLSTIITNFITGIFIMLVFLIGNDHITHLTLYFSIFIILLSMMLISDFTSVLIDVRDNYIILPKPINGKTVVLARLLHIFIYVCKNVFPLSIPAIIFLSFDENLLAGLFLFFLILFATLFSIFLISAIYILILKITTPEKFKNVISYFQIFIAIIIFAAYQLVPRLISKIGLENMNLTNIKWAIFMPSYWFACLFNWLYTLHATPKEMIAALLAVIVPIGSMYVVIKYLAPYFNQKLSMISGSEGTTKTKISPIKKNSKPLDETFAGIVTNNTIEKAGFLFTWKMMARSRDFKMSVYTTIGYIVVIIIVIIISGYKDGKNLEFIHSDKTKMTSQIIIGIYMTIILIMAAIGQMVYTEKYKAAWIYYSTPIIEPGQIISGSIKAMLIQLYLIIAFIFVIVSISLIGISMIPNLCLAIINHILIAYFIVAIDKKNFPFSKFLLNAKKSGSIKGLFMLFFCIIIGIIHYFIFNNIYIITIGFIISTTTLYFLSKYIKKLTWNEIELSTD